jgi:hypothetical protein
MAAYGENPMAAVKQDIRAITAPTLIVLGDSDGIPELVLWPVSSPDVSQHDRGAGLGRRALMRVP